VPDLPARPSPIGWIVAKKTNEMNGLTAASPSP
jgi:hypothetical protein